MIIVSARYLMPHVFHASRYAPCALHFNPFYQLSAIRYI